MRTDPFLESHPVALTQTELDERAHEAAAVGLKIETAALALEAFKESSKATMRDHELARKQLDGRLFELGRIVKKHGDEDAAESH